jgi:hypothetical protein
MSRINKYFKFEKNKVFGNNELYISWLHKLSQLQIKNVQIIMRDMYVPPDK